MNPKWSLILPTYNRPHAIREAVAAALAAPDPVEAEIIVVDDGSQPPLDADFEPRVRVLRQKNQGPAAARNRGAAAARAERLAFLDDDCAPRPGWLAALDAALAEAPGALLGGRTVNGLTENIFSKVSQDVAACLTELLRDRPGHGGFFASNNLALRKETFDRIGGFDTGYPLAAGEDRAFCLRAERMGVPFILAPEAEVVHRHPLTLASFWRQHYNYGRGAARFRERCGTSAKLPPGSWKTFIHFPKKSPHGFPLWQLHLTMLLAQAATATGLAREKLFTHRNPSDRNDHTDHDG